MAALRAQSLTNFPRRGLAEKSCFFMVANTERESFSRTGAFSVVETQAVPAAELTSLSKKTREDNLGILSRKKRVTLSNHGITAQLWEREEAELFYPSTVHQSPAVGFGWSRRGC